MSVAMANSPACTTVLDHIKSDRRKDGQTDRQAATYTPPPLVLDPPATETRQTSLILTGKQYDSTWRGKSEGS